MTAFSVIKIFLINTMEHIPSLVLSKVIIGYACLTVRYKPSDCVELLGLSLVNCVAPGADDKIHFF